MTVARHMYVHVPFCTRRCSYCDFAIAVRRVLPREEYLNALASELRTRLASQETGPLGTIYLGGGTPSKLGPGGVAAILDTIRASVEVDPGAEVSLEANPEDISVGAARDWIRFGVTRLSIGVQSFDDGALRWMHRTHDADDSRRAFEAARDAGFGDISMDLIFALPRELSRNWAFDIEQALALRPEHLSLYGLTVEPHTPLGRWAAAGEVLEAPEDSYATEFLEADRALAASGLEHYEVSNFALPSKRSRHNAAYWRRVPYVGIGPSAHSFDGGARRWNEREYASWSARVARGEDPIAGAERLSAANELAEDVYLGLRTSEGVAELPSDHPIVETWARSGWARVERGRIRLTPEGWLRIDGLAATLTAHRSR